MFGIDSGEILIIAVVALVVIGPKDLPRAMRTIGNFVGRARGMARHFRTGFDAMVREVDLEDMDKKWQADNERIMRDHPAPADEGAWAEPPAADPPPPRAAPASSRPQGPPARGRTLKSGAAPPIPLAAPRPGAPSGGDEGA
ncbi:MAG TPA: Sec-independent protein translocase protein TatB [Allosphingosinicella sp.]|nr:Sec-independent protein translocase protein TatB [Allosphingosinicella sp.]